MSDRSVLVVIIAAVAVFFGCGIYAIAPAAKWHAAEARRRWRRNRCKGPVDGGVFRRTVQ